MEQSFKIPTMLSIRETAERTGLSMTFIRHLCWDKKIPFIKTGCKYLVNLEGLIEFLNTPETE